MISQRQQLHLARKILRFYLTFKIKFLKNTECGKSDFYYEKDVVVLVNFQNEPAVCWEFLDCINECVIFGIDCCDLRLLRLCFKYCMV